MLKTPWKWSITTALLAIGIASVVSAQEGQGNGILTIGGDCALGGTMDGQLRTCAPEGTRVYLVCDSQTGRYDHPLGVFSVPFSEELQIRKGSVGSDGTAFFWLMIPDREDLAGRTMTFQGAYFDPEAPNGLSITNPICYPICEPGETFRCENGIARMKGILVSEPTAAEPMNGIFRVKSGDAVLAEVEFSTTEHGSTVPVQTDDGMMSVTRVSAIDPCPFGEARRLAVQFCFDASSLDDGRLPDLTTFELEADDQIVTKTLDTSCETPVGVGLRTRPLIITCLEERGPESPDLTTYTQGGWGTACRGNNPGCLRDTHFDQVFPSGLILGDPDGVDEDGDFALHLTNSKTVESFLPHGSTPGVFEEDAIDPSSSPAGVLAGQLTAATLNLGFNDAGVLGAETGTYGALIYVANVPDALFGLTVREVIALANLAISGNPAGLPESLSLSDLVEALTDFNEGTVETFGL